MSNVFKILMRSVLQATVFGFIFMIVWRKNNTIMCA